MLRNLVAKHKVDFLSAGLLAETVAGFAAVNLGQSIPFDRVFQPRTMRAGQARDSTLIVCAQVHQAEWKPSDCAPGLERRALPGDRR